jgi:hypothetical protein
MRLSFILFVLLSCLGSPAHAVTGLTPGATILIIGGDNDPNTPTYIKNALNALTPAPALIDICLARKNVTFDVGIAPALARCGIANLDPYCQVWDVRFVAGATTEYCTLTLGGVGTDQYLYERHLQRGGSLFLLGENEGQVARNENMIQLLNNWNTGALIPYPVQLSTSVDFVSFIADPLNFKGTPNVLTRRHTKWPGAVPLGQTGSGRPFDVINYTSDGGVTTDWVHAFGFLPTDTNLGSGRVFVELDWTSVSDLGDYGAYNSPVNEAEITAWWQNVYTWMGNCPERFTLTKQASVLPPASVCIGDSFNYLLCTQNVGTSPLGAKSMWDTLPPCFSYVSAVPAPASVTGNFVVWNLGAVPVGASTCVTLTVHVDSNTCP